MANESGLKDDTSIEFSHETSDSSFEIKIKTLDLQTHFFRVNGNMGISVLKEEIVTKIGVPLERQRLFYKGKALKDDELLSELNLEDGDTMHLVERQLETSNNQGVGTESSQNTSDIQSDNFLANIPWRLVNRSISTSLAHSRNIENENERAFVPDALTTISEYIDEMERLLQRNTIFWNDNQSWELWMQPGAHNLLDMEYASTPDYLSFILNRTEQLLRDNVTTAISNLSVRLQRIDSSSNPVLRNQIQYGSRRLGIILHHLGAMLLELGRVTMCLRMGETPEESFVRSGRAAYISLAGPNPSLIQLSPFLSTGAWAVNPVHTMRGQSVPAQSASQVRGSTAGRGDQHHEPGSPRAPPEGSESVQALGAQSDLAASGSVEQQASNLDWENSYESFASVSASVVAQIVNAMHSGDSVAQMTNIMQSPAFSRLLSALASRRGDSTGNLRSILEPTFLSLASQNSSDQLVQQRRMNFTSIIQLIPEVSQDVGRMLRSSAPVQVVESERQPESSDVMTSATESPLDCNYQVDLGQVVQRIEQNDDSRSIFGALLEISVRLNGEQNAYQDIFELGNNGELANEFMEVLRRDIRRRLANESS